MKRSSIVNLIAKRDHCSVEEALERVTECAELINKAIEEDSITEVDSIIADNLGLEPDYLEDILNCL